MFNIHIYIPYHYYSCWLDHSNGLIWAFVGPVILVLMLNTVMFIIALAIAKKSLQKRPDNSEGNSNALTLFKGNVHHM